MFIYGLLVLLNIVVFIGLFLYNKEITLKQLIITSVVIFFPILPILAIIAIYLETGDDIVLYKRKK